MNIDLLSNMSFNTDASDIWGYADSNGNEYAIIGLKTGTAVVNVTDPQNPIQVGTVSGPFSTWRDIKTYSHYAYVVEDQVSSSNALQIIDLSDLPNSVSLTATYSSTFSHAHDLYIDAVNGYAYVVGGNAAGNGGISILSLADPIAPLEVGTYSNNYVHDIYVLNDTAYASAVLSGALQILDVSNKSNPFKITQFNTVPDNFTHNAWTTEDGRIIGTTDEVVGGHLQLWDRSNLDNIERVGEYTANPLVKGFINPSFESFFPESH